MYEVVFTAPTSTNKLNRETGEWIKEIEVRKGDPRLLRLHSLMQKPMHREEKHSGQEGYGNSSKASTTIVSSKKPHDWAYHGPLSH